MNKRRERYCHLGSIGQVQAEQVKLRRMKRTNMKHLEEDLEDAKYVFSPSHLFHEAVGKLACSSPLFGNVAAGVQTAVSLFRNRKRTHKKSCGCE